MTRPVRLVVPTAALAWAALCGCAPKWTGAQVVTAPPSKPSVEAPEVADPQERLRQHYAALPLGRQVRAKRLSVLVIHVGDVAIHEHRPDGELPTFSAVLRSYTSFKERSLEDVDQYLNNVDQGYVVKPGEIAPIHQFIRDAVADVTYYRIDLRYTVDEPFGAVLVYEFREEEGDRLLDTLLLSPETTLGAIHFADQDGFDLDVDATVLHDFYRVALRNELLEIQRRDQK